MLARSFALFFVLSLFAGCTSNPRKQVTVDEFYTREVRLPNGKMIRMEVLTKPQEVMKGMMFRDSLAADRGMLFIHGTPGLYPYWMYQVRVPLDIVWLDQNKRITEILADTPPCPSKRSSECPKFGGHRPSLFVIELAAGEARKHTLRIGDRIDF